MGAESAEPASIPTGAVFLSYASQDAEAAQRICAALRSAGVEVWFDQSELRGGDAWDQQIRARIHDCRLFIPVISANSERRDEGYFRREWSLAADRTRDMAHKRAFLVPVVIDGTPERGASVPEKFHEFQWTRLPGGETPSTFVDRIRRLLFLGHPDTPAVPARDPISVAVPPNRTLPLRRTAVLLVIATVAALALTYFAVDKLWLAKRTVAAAPGAAPSSISAPQNSIAVLPFADLSEKHDQEYFGDSMAEEVIDLLAQVPNLRVPARTSSFYFKGKQVTVSDIARTLSVTHVLEGSVRRAGNTVRVTAQLIRADNDYHVWSRTYDRDLSDVLKVQDEIAASVVSALRGSLLAGNAKQDSRTVSSEAYSLYLQAHALRMHGPNTESQLGIEYLRKAVGIDPTFALAWAELASFIAAEFSTFGILPYATARAEAHSAAEQAIRLEPSLPLAHLALARLYHQIDWNWDAAETEARTAIALAPGNAEGYRVAGYIATTLGRFDEAIELHKKAVSLDPLYAWNYIAMAFPAYRKHDYAQAKSLYQKAVALSPAEGKLHYLLGSVLLQQGQTTAALEEMNRETDPGFRHCGRALVLDALGRKSEADQELVITEQEHGSEKAYWIALVYSMRNNKDAAFRWLDRAATQHDPGMLWIRGDPLLDNLTRDARFDALMDRIHLAN